MIEGDLTSLNHELENGDSPLFKERRDPFNPLELIEEYLGNVLVAIKSKLLIVTYSPLCSELELMDL